MRLTRHDKRRRRHLSVRKKVRGTHERPRLCVRKTLKHLYATITDDSPATGCHTVATFTTLSKETAGKHMRNIEQAGQLGQTVGKELKSRGIERIVFDRGGYRYHGCVKALADGVREAGIQF